MKSQKKLRDHITDVTQMNEQEYTIYRLIQKNQQNSDRYYTPKF